MRVLNHLALGLSLFGASAAFSVEGMWQPEQLPLIKKDLKAKGLAIATESLSELTKFPMNAIVSLGGCSASFVSELGLVLTNHHCAYGSIQYNSSADKNLLADGFLAASLKDELPAAPGSRILVTESIQDVTAAMTKGLGTITGLARYEAMENNRKNLIATCESAKGYRCRIDGFFGNSSYRLTKQLEIKDVRLVQAPPKSIGKFGGDIDNWMWPRHTGDFAFYRAYVGKDGKPAEFSKDNVPFKPAGFLKVDQVGTRAGDFVMVAGYPGRTNRHRLAKEVSHMFKVYYPAMKTYLDDRIALIDSFAKKDKAIAIAYAGRLAGLNNYSKNITGKLDGFAARDIAKLKDDSEKLFLNHLRASNNKTGIVNYEQLNQLIDENIAADELNINLRRVQSSALLGAAKRIYRLAIEKEKPNAQRESGYQERDIPFIKSRLVAISKRYNQKVDQELWLLGLKEAKASGVTLPKAYQSLISLSDEKRKKKIIEVYNKSKLEDQSYRVSLLGKSKKELEALDDPFVRMAVALYEDEKAIEDKNKGRTGAFQLLRSKFMSDMRTYKKSLGEEMYADANSTLRITYGTIQGFKNRQNESFPPFTKLEEINEKNTGKEPFDVPAKQMALIKSKDYGRWKLPEIKSVPVNFLADLDITGGNSGSATLNGKGELTGLVFDGVIEGVISDWAFDPSFTRSIHVDVRYMLWVLEKFSGDRRILKEMGVDSAIAKSH
ncbi:MAG: S46 family peptidase [Pseudobacteriovorax sp.]|nr:S46 family peptidase [Pseudobacteriovorax sp.]